MSLCGILITKKSGLAVAGGHFLYESGKVRLEEHQYMVRVQSDCLETKKRKTSRQTEREIIAAVSTIERERIEREAATIDGGALEEEERGGAGEPKVWSCE